jgi:hypothetical protein
MNDVTQPGREEPKKNSVQQLAELYTVVIGIALSIAIYNAIDQNAQYLPVRIHLLPVLGAFVFLVVPFYHGAMRHLFATYVEGGGSSNIKSIALLLDFFLLFLEGCLFVMMASTLGKPETFAWVVVTLLSLDSIWGFLAWIATTGAKSQFAEKIWAAINIVTAVVLALVLILAKDRFLNHGLSMAFVIMLILFLRTVIDYSLTWWFYFPEGSVVARPSAGSGG